MLRGFHQRPSVHIAGRRRACCRTCSPARCRGCAAAPSAPLGSPSCTASAARRPSDGVVRLWEPPTAVLSCLLPTVDRHDTEQLDLLDTGTDPSTSGEVGYGVWPFSGIDTTSRGPDDGNDVLCGTGHGHVAPGLLQRERVATSSSLASLSLMELLRPRPDNAEGNSSGSSRGSSSALLPLGSLQPAGYRSSSSHRNGSTAEAMVAAGVGDVKMATAISVVGGYVDEDVYRSETNATASSSNRTGSSGGSSSGSSRSSRRWKRLLQQERRSQRRGRKSNTSNGSSHGSNTQVVAERPMGQCGASAAAGEKGSRRRRDSAPDFIIDVDGGEAALRVAAESLNGRLNGVGYQGAQETRTFAIPPWLEARRINQELVKAGAWRHYEDILQLVEAHGRDFDRINTATALHRLGSCGLEPGSWEARQLLTDPRFTQLERLASETLPLFTPREVSNCLWALAKLGYRTRTAELAATAADTVEDSSSSSSSSRDGVGGSNGHRSNASSSSLADLVEGLCGREEILAHELGPQEVANSLWALGTMGHHPGEVLLRNLSDRLLQVLPQASQQDVSNYLLGLAKLGWSPGPHVLDQVARGSVAKIGRFRPQELSNSLWALARLGHRNEQLQAAIFRQALRRAAEFKPQELSSLVLAAATLGLGPGGSGDSSSSSSTPHQGLIPEPLLQKFCDQAVATLTRYGQWELSNLLWALAKLGYRHEALLRAAASQAARQLAAEPEAVPATGGCGVLTPRPPTWSSQSLSSALWAYARLGLHPGREFLRQACRHLSCGQRLSSYQLQELVQCAWALATLQYHDPMAMEAVEREVVGRLEGAAAAAAAARTAAGNDGSGAKGSVMAEAEAGAVAEALADDGAAALLRPQTISDLLWAYASLSQPAPGLFTALLAPLEHQLPTFTLAALADCIWAAAKLGVYDSWLMDAVASHVCSCRLPYLQPKELASLAWAYGELGHAHKALFDGLAARMVSYVWPSHGAAGSGDGGAALLRTLAAVCGAAGVFGWRYPALFDAAERLLGALTRQHCLDPQPGRPLPERLPRSRLAPMIIRTTTGTSSGSSNGSNSSSSNIGATEAAAVAAVPFSELDVASLAWGLSLVGGCSPHMWGQMMGFLRQAAKAREGGQLEEFSEEALVLLCQAYINIRLDSSTTPLPPGPRGLLRRGADLLRQRLQLQLQQQQQQLQLPFPQLQRRVADVLQGGFLVTAAAPSSLIRWELSRALNRLGLRHAIAVPTHDGLFSVDLALEVEVEMMEVEMPGGRGSGRAQARGWRQPGPEAQQRRQQQQQQQQSGRKSGRTATAATKLIRIAVEMDGPTRFTSNTRQPLATTLYRRRCLEARGWVVVSVPYWRWYDAACSPEQQDSLLVELLRDEGFHVD